MSESKVIECDGIIFDVDGTLWDSTQEVAESWIKAINQLKMKTAFEVTAEKLKGYFGKTMSEIADGIFPEETQERREQLMELCCKIENADLAANMNMQLYPGAKETIIELSKHIPVFIVSNCQSGYIEILVDKFGLHKYITDTECYGNNDKLKWENIKIVAQRNGLKKPIYVGDIQGDKDSCDKAGVPFIHAAYGFGEVDDCVARIQSMSELPGCLGY